MTLWLSPADLPLIVDEVIPDIAGQDEDAQKTWRCQVCAADLFCEGCPAAALSLGD